MSKSDQNEAPEGQNEAGGTARRANLSALKDLFDLALVYPWRIAAALFFLTGAALATLALPFAVRHMIDDGFAAASAESINHGFVSLVGVVGVLAFMSAARFYSVTWLGERVVADLRQRVFDKVMALDVASFDRMRSGELVSRLTADATQVKAAVGASASIALRNLFLFLGASVMMAVTSPRLSGFVLVAIPLVVLPVVIFGRKVRRRTREAQDRLAEASAFASETIGAARIVKSFTAERRVAARFSEGVETAFTAARMTMTARALLTAFAIFVIFSSVTAVLWVGAHDVLAGSLSGGELGQFVLYAVFSAGALGELSQVWGELSQAAGASERLSELLAEPVAIAAPARPRALPASEGGAALAFEDVTFAYGSGDAAPGDATVEAIALEVKPGETVALVGPSGAGKSTLFSLAMRFYDPQAGQVLINGVPLTALDPKALRSAIAVVPQDTTIFAGTIAENIAFGREDAGREAIEAAARTADADAFIRALPEGYDSLVGERGITLSGGERQRIAIARAVLKDAPLLLLDEATSALDSRSETAVQEALSRLMKARTTLVIAHRLSTVVNADRIVVLDGGRIVETGTHDSLMDAGGLYRRLAELQFDTDGRKPGPRLVTAR
ncbi:MAG: ATP-binding cassette domain-containing protein [Hyphomicrobiaceae bacterium]|nr:ATP-binding cassette domain-containing protein [Hyphomicrobiaceae bacterium]